MMDTLRLDLLWIEPKKGQYPFTPFAHIVPKIRPLVGQGGMLEDRLLLTPQLTTLTEVDYYADQLISDIEKIRRATHKKLRNFHQTFRK
jgi:hypothetical protein